jgi:ferritin-like metal-binding protein YciE
MGDLQAQLTRYLTDAHSIEEQALAQLRRAPGIAGDPKIAAAFEDHLQETEGQKQAIRDLLAARDADPSRVKDAVMAAGGVGFVLFARVQPDTPGKLMTHALSYEALERASYQLLRLVAERAGEPEAARVAGRIRDQEQAMMNRLSGLFDLSVDASLRSVGSADLQDRLSKYLADAHAIEEQASGLLERGQGLLGDGELAQLFVAHLAETRRHGELVEERLDALGGDPSSLKDALMRLGALNWGSFFAAHPDTPGKLVGFAYAFEHLEIGGYEQLKRVATRSGDEATTSTAERILEEERTAAEKLWAALPAAAVASLQAAGVAPGAAA